MDIKTSILKASNKLEETIMWATHDLYQGKEIQIYFEWGLLP